MPAPIHGRKLQPIGGLFAHPDKGATKTFWAGLEEQLQKKPITQVSKEEGVDARGQSTITPSHATVTVKSTPDGAEITVGGKFHGNSPSTLRLPAGDHFISIEKSGYKQWERTVTVTEGGTSIIDANLEKVQ